MKKTEDHLDVLIEQSKQQLVQGMSFKVSIQALQTNMMEVTERAEQVLNYLVLNSTTPFESTTTAMSDLVSTRTASQFSSVAEIMRITRKECERLEEQQTYLKTAFAGLQEETISSYSTNNQPTKVMKGLAKLLQPQKAKAEPPGDPPSPVHSEPPLKIEEDCAAEHPKIKSELQEIPYPALPVLPFPSSFPVKAAQYSIPPKLKLDLALIKHPFPQLSLVWSLDEEDPDIPPMDTYSVYLTTEIAIGTNVFEQWRVLGEYPAAPLPMFSLYHKYKPRYKICVCVVGKDKFGRYGPYSKVKCGVI
uniref:Activating transcription factor 7-interacting protein Fn3 domain-containing protein n=1 Tax=Knipowitschia caucasica TaxID=637954 RepID=A0AAV2KLU5_KNICA